MNARDQLIEERFNGSRQAGAGRRTPEAQADIAAAHALDGTGPAKGWTPEQCRDAVEQARSQGGDREAEAVADALDMPPPTLDAALSNAAIADTPAVREMGGRLPDTAVTRGSIRAWRRPGGNVGLDTTHVGSLIRNTGTGPHIVIERADLEDAIAALQALAGTPPPGEATPVLPPDAIVLTGPDAERYRAIAAAARKAQASAATARADGTALLQLFQAFCAGLAPGKDG
jgi:hypothetical protein